MIHLTIPRRVPSLNDFAYKPWHAYHALKSQWAKAIGAGLPARSEPPDRQVFVLIVSYRNRELDHPNLVGGAKPIWDVLQELNYLRDDNPQWMSYVICQFKVPKAEERTLIEVDL